MKSPLQLLSRLFQILEFDKAIIWNLAARSILAVTGPLVAFVVVRRFSAEAQGYYYTFASLLSLQIFLELGFGFCLIQFVSHEFAKLRWLSTKELTGDHSALSRLAAITRLAFRWYTIASIGLFVVLGSVGTIFFHHRSTQIHWKGAWWLLCFGGSIGLLTVPLISVLDGCNLVAWTARARIIESLTRSMVLVLALLFGAGLYAASFASITSAVILLSWILLRWTPLFLQLWSLQISGMISWFKEIWPFQWRIAVSWASGYLIYASFNPILFAKVGPKIAGQFGLTWSLIQAIGTFAGIFVNTRQPVFGIQVSKQAWSEMRRTWRIAIIQSVSVVLLLSAVLSTVIFVVHSSVIYSDRLLPWTSVIPLLTASWLNQVTFAVATLIRAEKREPFLWMSLLWGIFVISGSLITSGRWGATGMAWTYWTGSVVTFIYSLRILRTALAFKHSYIFNWN